MEEKQMKIYIAGPYTKGDQAQNVRIAIFEADYVTSVLGHVAFCPHLTHFWHIIIPHDDVNFWYKYDLVWLRCCDAVLRIGGDSEGADREVELAKELGLPIYTSVFDIPPARKW